MDEAEPVMARRPAVDALGRQQEMLRSLHAAIDALSLCVDRIEELISRVDRQMAEEISVPPVGLPADASSPGRPARARGTAARPPARVSFGGGTSVLGLPPRSTGADASSDVGRRSSSANGGRRGLDPTGSLGFRDSLLGSGTRRRADRPSALSGHPADAPEPVRGQPGTPSLMMATELALLGYSREEITGRLTERWGDLAAAIMHEALD